MVWKLVLVICLYSSPKCVDVDRILLLRPERGTKGKSFRTPDIYTTKRLIHESFSSPCCHIRHWYVDLARRRVNHRLKTYPATRGTKQYISWGTVKSKFIQYLFFLDGLYFLTAHCRMSLRSSSNSIKRWRCCFHRNKINLADAASSWAVMW